GWLQTMGPVAGTKGRPQQPLDIEENHGPRFIGIKVTAEQVHTVVATVRGNVLEELVMDLAGTDPQQILATAADPAAALAAALPGVVGIGLSVGGCVAGRRTVLGSNMLGWD